jgi:hypothetical protein
MNQSDAAGNGLSYSFGMLAAIVLWVLLAVLLVIAGRRAPISGWSRIAMLLLHPLSLAACLAAITLLRGRPSPATRLPMLVPVLAPLLMVGFASWSTGPALRAALPAPVAGGITWGVILVLSILPWPLRARQATDAAANRARIEGQAREEETLAAEQNAQRFHALTPASPLREWLAFTTGGNPLREEAFAAIRQRPRRQAEAEELIRGGDELPLLELTHLDLAPDAELAAVARDFLAKDAESLRPTKDRVLTYDQIAFRVERHLPAMDWLARHGCDIGTALDAYETTARLYPDSPARAQFLAKLAGLREQGEKARR